MALQFLDTRAIGAYIVDAWQNELNTELDPASGKWFTHGPGNSGGLFGGLTDSLATSLVFDENQKVFDVHPEVGASTLLDNRNGLLDTTSTFTLTDSITNTVATTHQTSNSIKQGIGVDIKATAKFFGSGVDVTTKLSFEYSFSWSDTKATTLAETKTVAQQIPLKVPNGKAYKVILTFNKAELTVPYSALIYVEGTSEANFTSAVNGKTKFTADAGTLCAWIAKYSSAKGDSLQYGADSAQPARGSVALKGVMKATQSFNFTVNVVDVTAELNGVGAATTVTTSPATFA
jgi:hypothetical protein